MCRGKSQSDLPASYLSDWLLQHVLRRGLLGFLPRGPLASPEAANALRFQCDALNRQSLGSSPLLDT